MIDVMKTYKTKILSLVTVLLLFSGISTPALSQTQKNTKESEELEMKENKEAIYSLLKGHQFVLTADRLMDKKLNTYMVSSRTNFIRISEDDVVIQFGLDHVAGWNGVGGLTVEGKLSDFDISGQDGLKPLNAIASISTRGYGFMTLYMTVFNDGSAQATLTGDFGSRLKFIGEFQTLDGASIYKGMALY